MKITPTNQWTYSGNSEFWYKDQYPTKEEAIQAGLEDYPEGCYIGSCYSMDFTYDDMDFSEYIIERLGDCIDEEAENCSQHWYNKITWDDEKTLEDYLAKAIMKWVKDCQLQPNQYIVNDIEWVEGECEDGCC